MTQEEKTLLMQVLCTMFPYEVILRIDIQPGGYINRKLSDISNITVNEYYKLEQVKPYLRPMSSMTEKEMSELRQWGCLCMYNDNTVQDIGVYGAIHSIPVIDWLNAHHFDYNGLIEKGLALEAPDGMYNFKKL